MAQADFALADLDPNEGETAAAAKERYLKRLETFKPEPSSIEDSGNGIQVLWRLEKPVPPEDFPRIEAASKAIMERLGSEAGTQNVDRLLRVPGTMNLPNRKKRDKGRVICGPAKVLVMNGAICRLEDLPRPEEPKAGEPATAKPAPKVDWDRVAEHAGWLQSVADLPGDFSAKGRMIVACDGNLEDLSDDLIQAGKLDKPYRKWSAVSMALAGKFKADGRFTAEQIAAALMSPLPCNRHITKMAEPKQRRAVERLIERSYEPAVTRSTLNWRECYAGGTPRPSMHNARLAITALGVECSYDTFHNKLLFGYQDDEVRHELQSILGEVTDDGIIRLRQVLSDRFGLDFEDKATRDAVKSLALEQCFDPVRDMLAKAQGKWDKVERLDRMAVDYLNADDTPLNRAIVRKWMIAGVRRVRRPGCKFDNIPVFESVEGWNKSGALCILAGDGNFSDEGILGLRGREVQEQLSEVWIHENADLAGMRKAEVEQIKAFASRQVDIARPAFGHFVKKQPRHSVEAATTNTDEYLQSQTGNRRFWPVIVRKTIDLEKLRRDRLQLWGEAATYEAAGESITLDQRLWPAARDEQDKRRTKDPWEDLIADIPVEVPGGYYEDGRPKPLVRIIHQEDGFEKVASADLLKYVLRIQPAQQETKHSMRLATVMRLAGWDRNDGNKITVGGRQVRGYQRRKGQPAGQGLTDQANLKAGCS